MALANVTIPLDPDAASVYQEATPEEQRRLSLLLSLWLRRYAATPRPLQEIMDEIGRQAEARGMTPEILESLLRAE